MKTPIYAQDKAAMFPDKILALRNGHVPTPAQVLISISDTCNHKCSWCTYRDKDSPVSELFLKDNGSPPNRFIPTDVCLSVIDDMRMMGVRAVQLTGGGEPCVHPDFGVILKKVLDCGMAAAVVTNGTNLKEEWIPLLRRCTWLRVSINAGDEETYRKIHRTGKGMWGKAWDFVYKLARQGPTLGVSMVVCQENCKEVLSLSLQARDAGADNVRICHQQGGPVDAWLAAERDIKTATNVLTLRDKFAVIVRPPVDLSPPTHEDCGYQYFAPYLGADMNLYRCCNTAYTQGGLIGSVKFKSFISVWDQMTGDNFDARGCPQCAFKEKNRVIRALVKPPTDHELFV